MLFEEVENNANLLERSFFVFSRVFLFCILIRVCLQSLQEKLHGLSCNLQL